MHWQVRLWSLLIFGHWQRFVPFGRFFVGILVHCPFTHRKFKSQTQPGCAERMWSIFWVANGNNYLASVQRSDFWLLCGKRLDGVLLTSCLLFRGLEKYTILLESRHIFEIMITFSMTSSPERWLSSQKLICFSLIFP